MRVSAIIPTWNEESRIGVTLARLRRQAPDAELVVCDGGSSDRTAAIARDFADRVICLPVPGRGAQLRRGAQAANGELLLFLHADCRLADGWLEALRRVWASPEGLSATVFSIRYDAEGLSYRLIERGTVWRCRRWQWAWGDHGFCVSRPVYEKIGGMPELPLMEDVAFCSKLRREGRIEMLPSSIFASARRLGRRPLLKVLENGARLSLFALGASPQSLWRGYYGKN
ncbi:MAG: TIGR04283 family arsenosugar biosynthesis glycosyltransferase [Elusimicrobia bacterium]|nr:TIGR04283 family arsenosugar biosynthesis glycosyltransferase [Elusimicrobiota bacterium]